MNSLTSSINKRNMIPAILEFLVMLNPFALFLYLQPVMQELTVREKLPKQKWKVAFDKNMEILLRLNGFFLGAIGVNMIVSGVKNVLLVT